MCLRGILQFVDFCFLDMGGDSEPPAAPVPHVDPRIASARAVVWGELAIPDDVFERWCQGLLSAC